MENSIHENLVSYIDTHCKGVWETRSHGKNWIKFKNCASGERFVLDVAELRNEGGKLKVEIALWDEPEMTWDEISLAIS